MAKVFNKLKIEVNARLDDIITGLVSVQNDSNSRYLDVFLYDNGIPIDLTEHEVRIYMRKPDGTEIFNNGEITDAVNGRCQFELTSQALGAVGVLKCEISIWQGNTEILTTQTFHVFVAESLRSNSSIESSNEYGALVVLFQNLYQSIDLMQDMVANFGTPSGAVDADTFWQMLEKLYEVNEAALTNASVSEVLARMGVSNKDNTLFETVELSNVLIDEVKEITNKVYNSDTKEALYEPSDKLMAIIFSGNARVESNKYAYLGKWTPRRNGIVNVSYTVTNDSIGDGSCLAFIVGTSLLRNSNMNTTEIYNSAIKELEVLSAGATTSITGKSAYTNLNFNTPTTKNGITTFSLIVEKNVPVYFLGAGSMLYGYGGYFQNVEIYGSEVTQ